MWVGLCIRTYVARYIVLGVPFSCPETRKVGGVSGVGCRLPPPSKCSSRLYQRAIFPERTAEVQRRRRRCAWLPGRHALTRRPAPQPAGQYALASKAIAWARYPSVRKIGRFVDIISPPHYPYPYTLKSSRKFCFLIIESVWFCFV